MDKLELIKFLKENLKVDNLVKCVKIKNIDLNKLYGTKK